MVRSPVATSASRSQTPRNRTYGLKSGRVGRAVARDGPPRPSNSGRTAQPRKPLTMTMARPPRRRRPAIWIVGDRDRRSPLLWCGYWYAAATLGNRALDRAVAVAERARSDDRLRPLRRLPARLDLRCGRASFADAGARYLGGVDGASLDRPALLAGRGGGEPREPLRRRRAVPTGLALTASWSSASATAEAGLRRPQPGRWLGGQARRRARRRLSAPALRAPRPHATPTSPLCPAAGNDYRFTAAADGLALVLKKERTLPPRSMPKSSSPRSVSASTRQEPASRRSRRGSPAAARCRSTG